MKRVFPLRALIAILGAAAAMAAPAAYVWPMRFPVIALLLTGSFAAVVAIWVQVDTGRGRFLRDHSNRLLEEFFDPLSRVAIQRDYSGSRPRVWVDTLMCSKQEEPSIEGNSWTRQRGTTEIHLLPYYNEGLEHLRSPGALSGVG